MKTFPTMIKHVFLVSVFLAIVGCNPLTFCFALGACIADHFTN